MHDNSEKDDSNSDDDSLVEDDAVNTSVLSAFNALQQPEKEQEKKLLIAELGDLEPVVYVDCEGEEHHLLTAPKVISNMATLEAENQPSSFIFIPKKRKKEN
ncbi:hypothetical protein AB4K20DRAFT_1862428 [Rhizopus microsporus]|uniref:Uncharacterized protein n=1 Tax=Rhizopus microsporus TaxID=58291 RepID=A0A1X0RZ72_RHIZD|nr:hypothetical protein BCV71DRAFT_235851 [Rhizopus microsporus]